MKYYIKVFVVYSMIGYIIETLMKNLFINNMNNGFLYGPWIPVYGLGACIIIFIMRLIFNRIKTNRIIKIILLFLLSSITLTILEFIGGHLIHALTGRVFWNYSDLKFNFGPYIALEISLVWGVMSLVVVYIIKPLLDKIIKKIPSFISYLALSLIVIDFIFAVINA